jgi:signal transduction histidine kinase
MRSLFLRIFLWFWLAMTAIVAVLVITSPLFTRSRPGVEKWHRDAENWARARVERAVVHIERKGVDDLSMGRGHGRGRGAGPPSPTKIYFIDEDGGQISGTDAPQEVFEISGRALTAGVEVTERTGMLHLVARPVEDPDGRRLVVVAAHHNPPKLTHLMEPRALALRLGVLILVVGGLSFWLARYLTSPMGPLRSATRRLSRGDLSARVGGNVGRRRDEIGDLARDFDAMAERIEALVGSQQRLLRDVSHELRSPLARLVVALELARSRAGDGATKPLDRIEREAGRLDELIGQLLLLERLEAGAVEGDMVSLDLVGLIAEVAADAGFEAAAVGTEVRFEATDGPSVSCRPELLRSAFDNVIRNAVHHTEPGSVVDVTLATDDGGVTVEIRDHGPGVSEADLERIFEPFYRVEEARDRASGGVGLGLAIAARAMRAHGGAIGAKNHPGGGLVVTVKLPLS